jgi:hypothetical protein
LAENIYFARRFAYPKFLVKTLALAKVQNGDSVLVCGPIIKEALRLRMA